MIIVVMDLQLTGPHALKPNGSYAQITQLMLVKMFLTHLL